MHKRLTLLLAALLVFGSLVPVAGENPFYDVPTDHWAYESIEYLSEAGLIEGYPDGTFGGSRNFTRYEMAMVFARILARFEQRVDDQVARGVEARTAGLNDKVAVALENAAEALRIANEAKAAAGDDAALQIAVGTLEAIDSRGYDASIDEALATALKALAAAEAAQKEAETALAVALGTIDALDEQGQPVVVDNKGIAKALADAAAALAAAEQAKAESAQAVDKAVKIIDARGYDESIKDAMDTALAALAAAKAAQDAADGAMAIAIGTLEAVDGWEPGGEPIVIPVGGKELEKALADAAAALAAAEKAKAASDEALKVALAALDGGGKGTEGVDTAALNKAIADASAALTAADQAKKVSAEALNVALGILDALDAQEAVAPVDNEARASAAAALVAAQKAQAASDEALSVALGILDALDAQPQADKPDEKARALAAQALAEAQAASLAANNALQIAIGTLDALDANEFDARIDEANAKAAQALALAKALEDGTIVPAGARFVMDGAARAAMEEIAADVVAKKLLDVEANADRISRDVKSLEANTSAVEALLAAEVARLENEIGALMAEFGNELGLLGIRVATLESKFTTLDTKVAAQGEEIDAIWDRLNRVRVTGSNETIVARTRVSGDTPRYVDPRDPDAGAFPVHNQVSNRLTLRIDAKPYDDVDVEALLDVVVDGRLLQGSYMPLLEDSRLWAEARSDQALRVLRLGNMDGAAVASGFTPYAVDAKTMDKTSNVGIYAHVVQNSLTYDLIMGSVVQTGQTLYGVSGATQFDDMNFRAGGYRLTHPSGARTVLTAGADAELDGLSYDAQITRDLEKSAWAYDINVDLPIESVDVNFLASRLDGVWATNDRLPFAAEYKTQDPATFDKPADINDPVFADQRLMRVRADAPVGSFNVFGQMGKYHERLSSPTSSDGFSQYGLYNLDLFGLTTDVTRSHFTNRFDEKLFDQRINMTTRLDDIDVQMQLHKQVNEQYDAAVGEAEQAHFMLTAQTPIQIIVPWTGELTFGTSLTAPVQNPVNSGFHSGYKLTLDDYEVADRVAIDVELSGTSNRIEKGLWRKNTNWTGQEEAVRSIAAKWAIADPMTVNVGYKSVDNNVLGHTTTRDLGFEYFIDTFFAGDLKLGYDYRLVHHNGVMDGTGRSIIRAAFSRVLGDLRVNADAKYAIGGRMVDPGNEYDTVASLDMSYPVFTGAMFTAGGKYVKSDGGKIDPVTGLPRAEYKGLNVSAGLKFNF